MTVSAAVRLMPSPPALVHNRNTNRSESGLEKRSMAACLSVPLTPPSMRSYKYLNNMYKRLIISPYLLLLQILTLLLLSSLQEYPSTGPFEKISTPTRHQAVKYVVVFKNTWLPCVHSPLV